MVLDPYSGQPVLANRSGGISGPALKPIALKAVYDARKACPQTPIIGTGGVSSGQDAVEMLMAGATVVGVGSAIYQRGADAIQLIRAELQQWMAAQKCHLRRRSSQPGPQRAGLRGIALHAARTVGCIEHMAHRALSLRAAINFLA